MSSFIKSYGVTESFGGAKHPSHSTCLEQQQTPPQTLRGDLSFPGNPRSIHVPCKHDLQGMTRSHTGQGHGGGFSCPGSCPFLGNNPTESGYTSHSAQHNLKWSKRNCSSNRIFFMAHFKQRYCEQQGPDFQPKLFHCPCSFLGAADCRLRHNALMPEYLKHEHKQTLSHLSSLSYTQK